MRNIIILAFETSCDDTSIALFKNDKLLVMNTASQIKIHNKTGWVIPEIAAREHANIIFQVLKSILKETDIKLKNVNYIWVTTTPWLIPSLLTWITVANTLSNILKIPLVEINHIEAHIFSIFLEKKEKDIKYPLVCLTVSGWHNEIYYMKNMWDMIKIGWTTDDSAWEAFDKVSKMLWLSYPWWPIISKLSEKWKQKWKLSQNIFPRVWLKKDKFDFSFSWLKSAVKREVEKEIKYKWKLDNDFIEMISFEFENAITEVLAYKLVNACLKHNIKTIALTWWVSANNNLQNKIKSLSNKYKLNFIYPKKIKYCMDNAAMVWINIYYKIKEKLRSF